jgi:asparagine synthase (glutamine-hydrolysing)
MCGIAGFNWEDRRLAAAMCAAIAHRGPDDAAVLARSTGSLGHRRLSIIDLSERGRQPMPNADKSLWITYNGELYNYKELRMALEAEGHHFRSQTDTEVVLYAFQQWGPECLSRFNGMFAFCIFAPKTGTMFLARDRVGIKPLYYFWDGKRLLFASEIKAILECPAVPRELCPEALVDYLAFQNAPDDKTFFKGIKLLRPGHYALLAHGKLDIREYWRPSLSRDGGAPVADAPGAFAQLLRRAVSRHLMADVPVGAYLSSGFDSSSVAACAAEQIATPLHTFTGKFDVPGYDESACSRKLAERIGANYHDVTITAHDFIKDFVRVIYHLDEPRAGIPAISQYKVSELVSRHVKVVLTGHAGDELFAGYPVFLAKALPALLRRNPLLAFKLPFALKRAELARLAYFLVFPLFSREVRTGHFIIFNGRQRKRLLSESLARLTEGYDPVRSLLSVTGAKDSFNRTQEVYFRSYLPSLLIVEDKMGMAHSIEARTPLCDNEVVEFAWRLGPEQKLRDLRLKSIVKDAMRGTLPEIYYQQPKRGFPTPFVHWLRKELKGYAYGLLLSERATRRGIFRPGEVKRLLDRHCKRKSDGLLDLVNAARIWSLLCIELWFRLFIDRDAELLAEVKSRAAAKIGRGR